MSVIKKGLQSYCDQVYSNSTINQTRILKKHYKELLDSFNSLSISKILFIQTYDFCTLCNTIPHEYKKKRLKETIHNAFYFIHGWQRYKFTVLAHELTYCQSQTERHIVLHIKRSHHYAEVLILSITYLSISDGTFLNESSASQWKQSVHLSLMMISVIRIYAKTYQ